MAFVAPLLAFADLRPEKIHVAENRKTEAYIRDGLFVGGDRAIDQVTVTGIHRAAHAGYERVVIDLEGTQNGEPAAVSRPPYYQVAVTPDEKRLVFTMWGKPRLAFNTDKVTASFRKSSAIESIQLLPRVEADQWTFVMELKNGQAAEVFELGNPVRVIVDIRTGK